MDAAFVAALTTAFTTYVATVYDASVMGYFAAAFTGSALDVDRRVAAVSVAEVVTR